jgi:uncharacterized protein
MEYVYRGLRRSIFDSEPLRKTLAAQLDLPDVDAVVVERESVDARRKSRIEYVYNVRFTVSRGSPRLQSLLKQGSITRYEPWVMPAVEPRIRLPEQPVIVGFGPAGMFAGLELAKKGYRPIIFERGPQVASRAAAIGRLWERGELDPEANVQFGEGGAGAFSDGKLTTGKASPLDRLVLETFVAAGAPETILFRQYPHIGTDYLQQVVSHLRSQIVALGGEVHFGQRLEGVQIEGGALRSLTISGARIEASAAILAIGHSARDTIGMLHDAGVAMVPKPFAIGARIEHPAGMINVAQYGEAGAKVLPPATYKLTHTHNGSGVYSFCMCPGGIVMCASSEPGGQVTNGMSYYQRDGRFSNSALVVGIRPDRVGISTPADAMLFLRRLEQQFFDAGGGGFVAPAQRASEFVRDRCQQKLPETSYRPGVTPARLDNLLPPRVVDALKSGLADFSRRLPGFLAEGVLIGLESRTSSPVQMTRDDDCRSASTEGLYVLGEGAGYAGGIMTCARDAARFAQRVQPWK